MPLETETRSCCLERIVAYLDNPHSTLKSRIARAIVQELAIREFGSMMAARKVAQGYEGPKATVASLTQQVIAWEEDPAPAMLLARIARYLDDRRCSEE